jgi:hypothetical protein
MWLADKTAQTRNRVVPGGTIDHDTAAVTTARGFRQSDLIAFYNIFFEWISFGHY